MIEKLDIMNSGINVIDRLGFTQNVPDAKIYCNKINEIIDIINAIVVDVDGTKCVDGSKAPADPYAEQRKWIGKLCRFWDFDSETPKHFGILTSFDETATVRYKTDNGFWYYACEPVKPDDDIIYQGGDK